MANLVVVDGAEADKYLKTSGAGTDLDPHIPEHKETSAVAISLLRKKEKGLRLIVSFADPNQDHYGGIYQAGNWLYSGKADDYDKFQDKSGRVWHPRQVSATGTKKQYGEYRKVPKISDCKKIRTSGKYRYLYPLDRAMRKQIAPLAKPYPKRETCGQSVEGDTIGDQSIEVGSIPTGRSE
jgi:hypothetical protein